jgi:23S rRNA (uracil1939-C5)-methyltransferase
MPASTSPPESTSVLAGPWNARAETCTDLDGIELRVPGLIPGEAATVQITGRSRGGPVAWGVVESIEEPHPGRRRPPCVVHDACGGCGLQFAREEARVRALVDGHLPRLPAALASTLAPSDEWIRSPGFGWRHKAVLLPAWKGGRVTLGGYARGTHDVVDQPDCGVLGEGLRRARAALLPVLEERAKAGMALAPPGGPARRGLRALVLRGNRSGEVLVTAVLRSEEDAERLGPYLRNLCADGDLAGAFVQVTDAASDQVHGRAPARHVGGAARLLETIAGVDLPLLPLAFFQVNPGVLEGIVGRCRTFSLGAVDLLDAYCGVGALGVAVAAGLTDPPRLRGCDVVEDAVEAAADAARTHGLRADYSVGTPATMRSGASDLVLLDPPRKGCADDELDALLAGSPRRMVYVSCSADSLGRDAARILDAGYEAVGLWPADMLPQTAHLEFIAAFDRTAAPRV